MVMAEVQMEKNLLDSLKEEVKCPICLEVYSNPKMLPCPGQHVFCAKCLQVLILRVIGTNLTCPMCQEDCLLQGFDVNQFPKAYRVNRLAELYRDSMKQKPVTCILHTSQPLVLYCETCKSLMCRDCVITSCYKDKHKFCFIKEMAKIYETELEENLQPIRTLHQQMLKELLNISTAAKELENGRQKDMEKVETTFDALSKLLEEQKRYFSSAVEEQYREQKAYNDSKRKALSNGEAELLSFIKSVEALSLQKSFIEYQENVLKKQTIMEMFKGKFTEPLSHPVGHSSFTIKLMSPEELYYFCMEKNVIENRPEGHLDKSTECLSMILGQPFETNFHFKFSPRSLKIDSKFVCSYDNSSQSVGVTQISSKTFSLSVVPQKRGRHQLHVQHDNTHLCGSPISSYVSIDPRQITTLGKPIRISLHNPGGVKCSDDKVFVAEMGKGITILQHSSSGIQEVKTLPVMGIGEVAVHEDFLYCTDQEQHQVIRMDMSGLNITRKGQKGTQEGLFNYPNGLAISKSNEVYVCDTDNHRLQVFDTDLNFKRLIGGQGDTNIRFASPSGLVFDTKGNLYVVDTGRDQIKVFTGLGKQSHIIGKTGGEPEKLRHPISAAIHGDFIYITDCYNDRIAVFTLQGVYVTAIEVGDKKEACKRPECIAIDSNGYICVTTDRSGLIVL